MFAKILVVVVAMAPGSSPFSPPVTGDTASGIRQSDEKRGEDSAILTKQEAAALRAIIYDEELCTGSRLTEIGLPERVVILRKEVIELHQKKRVATLRLLLDIVRGGRAKDALAAAVTAVALEEGPDYAVFFLHVPLDAFDNARGANERTLRDRIVANVEEMLAGPENQQKRHAPK
jgi:hypothetical protein